MGSAAFTALVFEFPTMAGFYRGNPTATPPVPAHRPAEEIVGGICTGIVSSVVGLPVDNLGPIPPGLGDVAINVGASYIPDPEAVPAVPPAPLAAPFLYSADFTASVARAPIKTAAQASVGWTGEDGLQFLDILLDSIFDTIDSSVDINFSASGGVTTAGGATANMKMTLGSTLVLDTTIASASRSAMLATGKLHLLDDTSNGVSAELEKTISAVGTAVKTYIDSHHTLIIVPPIVIPPVPGFLITAGTLI
jgi:hypothetical protein